LRAMWWSLKWLLRILVRVCIAGYFGFEMEEVNDRFEQFDELMMF
jgi:hypothetical protein